MLVLLAAGSIAAVTNATHSWGGYHWARKANPFTLKLGDNVSSAWDSYLAKSSTDWSQSSVLDTTIVAGGTTAWRCRPTNGRVEVCNYNYGNTGWLGVAQIWIRGNHITKGTAKMNDTYFSLASYDTPAWRNLVMCQEIAHTFGLDHQDEDFNNTNLGTCMDYTADPDGPPSNEHPNAHDYAELETIYSHLDTINTFSQKVAYLGNLDDADDVAEFGESLRKDRKGKTSLYVRDLDKGEKVLTFVLWIE